MRYDMVIICGLPRSGTTFLNNLFAVGAFGDKYYAQHSSLFGGLGQHPLHLCESQVVGMSFRHGIKVDDLLFVIDRFWRRQHELYDHTLVYKHPQIILDLPFMERKNWKIKYIFCLRDYVSWRESFIGLGAHLGIHPDSTDSHYREHWPRKNWRDPEDMEARLHVLYDHFISKSELEVDSILFEYGSVETIRENLAKLLIEFDDSVENNGLDKADRLIERYWRSP